MRRLARPFVITLAGTALACSDVDSAPGSTADAADGATSLPDASGEDVTAPTGCAADYDWGCPAWGEIGDECPHTFACSSGTEELRFVCAPSGFWEISPTACALPFDFCESDWVRQPICSGGAWRQTNIPAGVNPPPPPPCSMPRPANHATCDYPKSCGYFCDDATTWTVATCSAEAASPTNFWWTLDPSCPADGGDGG